MLSPPRLLALLLTLVAAVTAPAQPLSSPETLPPELQAELQKLTNFRWTHAETIRISAGHRDNVLLSAFSPVARSFGRTELELFALNTSQGTWDWRAFLNGDVLRYVSPLPEAKGEQQWFLHGEAGWKPLTWLRTTLAAQAYYQDMVLDLSETEADRVIAPLRVRGCIGTLTTPLGLPWKLKLEPSVQFHRSDFLNYAGDYSEVKEGARLSWKPREILSLSAGWYRHQRRFSQRTEFTAGGRALPDTRLRFDQQEFELKANSSWQRAGKWNVSVSASQLRNRDGASGYFDYDQKRGKAELEWNSGKWSVTASQELQHQDYLVQRVGVGINPAPRSARSRDSALRLEYHLTSAWTLFIEGRNENTQSNETEFTYRARSFSAGVERTF